MALARIFSRYPEQLDLLRRQLQQQGYSVEFANPGEAQSTAADLEIQMEECEPDDLLQRAGELAAQFQADIAIAPGVLIPATEDVATASAAALPPSAEAAPEEPAILASAADANDDQDDDQDLEGLSPGFPARAVRTLASRLGSRVAGARHLLTLCRAEFREQLEQGRLRMIELHERRQERLLELMRGRLEARLRVIELEGVRRAAAVALAQQDIGGPPGSARAKVSTVTGRSRIWNIRVHKRAAAMAGLVAAGAILAGGLAVATFRFHREAPSSQGTTAQGSGFTIPGAQPTPAAVTRPSPARPSPVVRAPASRPRQVYRTRGSPRKNQGLVASDVVVHRITPPKPTPRTQANGWKHFSDLRD
jgi:hypothetical protein